MSSNLTGTFIANTYQKLLQVDTDNGSVGSTAPFSATNAKTTSKHNILNGLGQSVGGLVIDQTGVSGFNGGLYLKNTTSGANNDSKASWTLQTSGDGGFNISRGGEDNYKLFLKQSGSVWVGYDNSNVPASDVSGHNLYVREGIKSGIYSGWEDFPNTGQQSNQYSLTNKVLQLGNNTEIFTSGVSVFSSNNSFDNQVSSYCEESSIASTFFLPQLTSDCRIIWMRVGQVVFCSFIVTNTEYLGESGNVQRAIIPVPVNTSSGYANRGNGGFDNFGFGSAVAYVSPDKQMGGGGRNSNNDGIDNTLEAGEVKMGGSFGGNQKTYFTISVNYQGSSGDINSWRGTFAYLV